MSTRELWIARIRSTAFVLGAGILCMLGTQTAWAQLNVEHNTLVTFSAPVEVPGSTPQVLPAGKYTFKVVDSKVNRNIVQIANEDETHVYTTILAIPIRREVETDQTVMTFEERPAGQPQALKAWFYPHERMGQEFLYSKERATELAKSSNSRVPYSESASLTTTGPTAVTPSPIMRMTPGGESVQSEPLSEQSPSNSNTQQVQTTPAPPTPQAAPIQQAQATSTAPAPIRESPAQATNSLPNTGSNLPTVALFGCLFVVAGYCIRRLCER